MARLKAIIQTWVKNKVLEVFKRKDEKDRHEYEFIVAGPASRCASTDDDNAIVDDDDPDCQTPAQLPQTSAQLPQTSANGDSEAGELRKCGFPPFRGEPTPPHTQPGVLIPPQAMYRRRKKRGPTASGRPPSSAPSRRAPPCARCGQDEAAGYVYLYRDDRTMRSEALHEQCA
jgi:hypothetical protein